MNPLLSVTRLTRRYAGLVAVDAVSLDLPAHGIHALIGPNGAGKTTLFNLVSGVTAPSDGRIAFAGHDITRLPPDRRARLGIARTFQNIRLFAEMSLLENVMVGLHGRERASLPAILGRLPSFRRAERAARAAAMAALETVGLAAQAGARAAALAYGEQRLLEIARAVVGKPRLLLVDEPAAGMNPSETSALAGLIRRVAKSGVTVLLVEHDMGFVMGLADSVTVLSFGKLIFHGTPAAARTEPAVVEAYLGHRLAARLASVHG